MRLTPLLAAITCVVLSACTDIPGLGQVCTLELRTKFTPADTSIRIGEAFRASVALSSCGGAKHLTDVIIWRSDDSLVATVDPSSGRVLGRGAGQTRVSATGQKYGPVGGIGVLVAR